MSDSDIEEGVCPDCEEIVFDCEHLKGVCPSCQGHKILETCHLCLFEGKIKKYSLESFESAIKLVKLGKKSETLPELKSKNPVIKQMYKLFKAGFKSK
jgi:hypothetical protein